MGYNIEWAEPEVSECWSFNGRLYQTESKAQYERARKQEYRAKYLETNPEPGWWEPYPPVYKITWTWEEA